MGIISAATELGTMLQAIQPVMVDTQITRDEKRSALNTTVNSLSEDTFKRGFIAERIIDIINMDEKTCEGYDSVESQVQGILEWLPRMEQHLHILQKRIKRARKHYKLNI